MILALSMSLINSFLVRCMSKWPNIRNGSILNRHGKSYVSNSTFAATVEYFPDVVGRPLCQTLTLAGTRHLAILDGTRGGGMVRPPLAFPN